MATACTTIALIFILSGLPKIGAIDAIHGDMEAMSVTCTMFKTGHV